MPVHSSKTCSLLLLMLATVVILIFSSIYVSRSIRRTAFTKTNQHRDEVELLGGGNIFWERKENSTHIAKIIELTTKPAVKTESDQTKTEAETPVPVLYKKDFKKLPQWDFEDVYNQDALPRNTTCVESLRNSKDKSFREAFLPNIRLFLHKDNINMSEWNRLSHFNNPFGFMEYKYDDVMASVKLIPKPSEPLLLPKPGSGGCVRCAVVGTGGILNGSGMGSEIDSHDYVFRMNNVVISGYEQDVGNKTSVYVHTAHSIRWPAYLLKEYGYTSIPKDEGIKHVLVPEGMRDFQWLLGLLRGEQIPAGSYKSLRPREFYAGQYNESRFYVVHQDFLRYVRNRFLRSEDLNLSHWSIVRPTNGAFTIFLALHNCDTVSLYGFMTEDYKKYSNYYFERKVKTKVVLYANHDYLLEMKTWKKLHNSKIVKLYQRAESERGTEKPEPSKAEGEPSLDNKS